MIIQNVITALEELAPLAYSENFDNTGLLIGDKNSKVTGILVCLDTLEATIDEALKNQCNLIVSFHPIVFSGLKKINGNTYVERVVIKAIKNDIAIFAIHTALDNSWNGVNAMLCEKLRLINNRQVLIPQKGSIKKLITYVPKANAETLKMALFNAGAGSIGNYSHCSFSSEGIGSFKGNEASKPTLGRKGELQIVEETQIAITFPKHLEGNILKALFASHPYEEVAYEITTLENNNQKLGMGMIAELSEPSEEHAFLSHIKQTFKTGCLRHSKLLEKPIKRVAVLGGSGSFAIEAAKAAGADLFITSDLKYHDFFKAENSIVLADIGHYESEQFTKNLIVDYLSKKFTNFATVLSLKSTNPIQYL